MAKDERHNKPADDSQSLTTTASAPTTALSSEMANWDEKQLFSEGFTNEFVFKFTEVGEKCRGHYMGPGADIDMKPDEKTGEIKTLHTWRVQNGSTTVRIIGTHELDQFFGGLQPGIEVALMYIGEQSLGRNRVKRYKMMSNPKNIIKVASVLGSSSQGGNQAHA